MRDDYLDAISELEEALSPFHLESDGEWTNYEFNTSTIRIAIEALEKQITKKPRYYIDMYNHKRPGCPGCPKNEILYAGQKYCSVCGTKIDWSDK